MYNKVNTFETLKEKLLSLDKLDYKKQEQLLNKMLRFDEDNSWVYLQLGLIERHKNKDNKKALSLFEKSLNSKPDFFNAIFQKGVSLRMIGEITESINLFETLIKKNPKHGAISIQLAASYQADKKFAHVIQVLKQGLSRNPSNININNNLLLRLFLNKQWEDLYLQIQKSIEESLEDEKFIFYKSIHYHNIQKYDACKGCVNQYLNLLLNKNYEKSEYLGKSINYSLDLLQECSLKVDDIYSFEKEIRIFLKNSFNDLFLFNFFLKKLWELGYHSDVIEIGLSNTEYDISNIKTFSKSNPLLYNKHIQFSRLTNYSTKKKNIFLITFPRAGSSFFLSLFNNLENGNKIYEPFNTLSTGSFTKEQSDKTKKMLNHTFHGNYFEERNYLKEEITATFLMSRMNIPQFCNDDVFPLQLISHELWLNSLLKENSVNIVKFTRAGFIIPWLKKLYPNSIFVSLHRDVHDIYKSMRSVYIKSESKPFFDNISDINVFNISDIFKNILHWNKLDELDTTNFTFYHKLYITYSFSNYLSKKYCDIVVDYEDLVKDPSHHMDKILATINENKKLNIKKKPHKNGDNSELSEKTIEHMKNVELETEGLLSKIIENYENNSFVN